MFVLNRLDLYKLINQSNYDLKERNKNFTNIIVELENNLLELFNETDYSNIFREHLDFIIEQLNSLNDNPEGNSGISVKLLMSPFASKCFNLLLRPSS